MHLVCGWIDLNHWGWDHSSFEEYLRDWKAELLLFHLELAELTGRKEESLHPALGHISAGWVRKLFSSRP